MDLQQICDQRILDKRYMISLASNKQIKQQIVKSTNWLPDTTPLKIRALTLHKQYTFETFPRCYCGNLVTYDKVYQNSFSNYCCSDCSRKDKRRLNQDTYNKLSDYHWLYEQRITQKKSFEEIASELQCSITPVKKACSLLKIPDVKWNQSDSLTKSYLNDKQWLIEKHCVQKMKVSEIADMINSSPATVSRWLQYHQITTNNPNEYDRDNNRVSEEENSVVDYIKSIYNGPVLQSNRTILRGKELDIVLPELKIAIEYNGIYSHVYRPNHSEPSLRKDVNYHLSKTIGCQESNYDLIHIFSDDWLNRTEIVKSILQSRIGVVKDKIYARKCTVGRCTKTEKKIFLNQNHIQGNDKSTIELCLRYNGQIVSVMTFCKSRYNKKYQYELSRFCIKNFIHVPGAFSKLLCYFEKSFKPKSIVSYCDYSRSVGNVYVKNGFQYVKRNRPSYSYVNLTESIERKHRSNFTKQKIEGRGTEEDIMYEKGYHKIFDCGTLVFVKQYTLSLIEKETYY